MLSELLSFRRLVPSLTISFPPSLPLPLPGKLITKVMGSEVPGALPLSTPVGLLETDSQATPRRSEASLLEFDSVSLSSSSSSSSPPISADKPKDITATAARKAEEEEFKEEKEGNGQAAPQSTGSGGSLIEERARAEAETEATARAEAMLQAWRQRMGRQNRTDGKQRREREGGELRFPVPFITLAHCYLLFFSLHFRDCNPLLSPSLSLSSSFFLPFPLGF